jgi:nucleoside-diphosphate-sugar epimerase
LDGAEAEPLRDMGAEVVGGDVRDTEGLQSAMDGIELVIHAAGVIHPRRSADFIRVNAEGARNVARAAQKAGARRLVHISSNSAQGTTGNRQELMREDGPLRPCAGYGRSKWLAEEAVREARKHGLETVILRPCWFYGPRQPERQTTFFRMIASGRPVVFGSGENLRSLTYIDNLVQAVILAARSQRAAGETYWVADERPHTTLEIYHAIAKALGATIRPRHVPALVSALMRLADEALQWLGCYVKEIHVAGEMTQNIACDIRKAVKELGYRPTVELHEGMRRSVEWCRQHGIELR